MSSPSDTDLWFLRAMAATVLVAASDGTLDLNHLAREELIRRGLGPNGEWVGPRRTRELHTKDKQP